MDFARIIASIFPYNKFPTTRGWVEKQRWEDLPRYAACEASDLQQFLSFEEAAENRIQGEISAKMHPEENSAWLDRVAREVLDLVRKSEEHIDSHRNQEFDSTMVDLSILAHLAFYHAKRSHAGLAYALWKKSGDINLLDRAIAHVPVRKLSPGEALSIEAMVSGPTEIERVQLHVRGVQGGRLKLPNATVGGNEWLISSMEEVGPYRYQASVPTRVSGQLEYFLRAEDRAGNSLIFPAEAPRKPFSVLITADNQPPILNHTPVKKALPNQPLKITANVRENAGVEWVRLRYRGVTQFQDYKTLEMRPNGKKGEFEAVIPGQDIVPEWDFMYLFEVMDKNGNGKTYPDLDEEAPYHIVELTRGTSVP